MERVFDRMKKVIKTGLMWLEVNSTRSKGLAAKERNVLGNWKKKKPNDSISRTKQENWDRKGFLLSDAQ